MAALSVKHIASRWTGLGGFTRQAPCASAVLIVLSDLSTSWLSWRGIEYGPRAAVIVRTAG